MSRLFFVSGVIKSILIALSLSPRAWCQPGNLGYAPYAMMSDHWDCRLQQKTDSTLAELRIATLWNTFGTNTDCLKKYLADPRLKAIEIHLINEVCQRRVTCGAYEFLYGMSMADYNRALKVKDPELLRKLRNYFKAPAQLLAASLRAGTNCYVSPGLESNLDLAAAGILIEQARESFPNCRIVWNPVNGSKAAKPISGTVFEQHHPEAVLSSPCIASLDGFDIKYPSRSPILPQNISSSGLPEVARRFRSCDLNLLWIAEYNGISDPGRLPDPRQRTSFPTEPTFGLVIDSVKTLQSIPGLFEDPSL